MGRHIQRHEGVVKYVNSAQGYGWIRCFPHEAQFGMDVLITDLRDLVLGDRVQFSMQRTRDGVCEAFNIHLKPKDLKTMGELLGDAMPPRLAADPRAAIEALKEKRDLRSIGVPRYRAPEPVHSQVESGNAQIPGSFNNSGLWFLETSPPLSSTAGADAVAADPAVAALVPCVGSPCLQPNADPGKEQGEEILNFMRHGPSSGTGPSPLLRHMSSPCAGPSPLLRPTPARSFLDDHAGLPPPPPPGDGPASSSPPPPPPPRRMEGPAVVQRGRPLPWQGSLAASAPSAGGYTGYASPRSPPPPPPQLGPPAGPMRPGPSELLRMPPGPPGPQGPPGPPPAPQALMLEGDTLEDEWRNEGDARPSRTPPATPATANEGRAAADRYEGIIMRVGEKFGFLRSFSFSENVYVDRKQLPKMEKNMKVTFRAQVTKKGVNALDVRAEGAVDPEESLQMEPLTHEGIVKKIDGDRKYGFIVRTGDQPADVQGDVFIHKKLLGDLKLGDRVRFSLKVKNGKAEAVRLEPVTVEDDGVPEDAPEMVGYIKSFEESQGYGFIRSPQATQNYNMGSRDVFLHRKQLKNFKAGDRVRFKVKLNRDGHPQAFRLRETDEVAVEPAPVAEERDKSKSSMETWIGEIKSFNPINGFGFIRNSTLQEKYGRDVFLPESQFEGLKIGDSVSFVLQVKDGKPQAFEVKRLSKKSLTSPALAPVAAASLPESESLEVQEVKEVAAQMEIDPQELSKSSRRLIRACQSERPGSIDDVAAALEEGAEVNARDVTGQTAIMISSLNTRGADRKCKLLLEHRADLQLPSNPASTQSTLEWVKERINQRFADYLEALSKGEVAKLEVTLDAPVADEF